MYSIVCLDNLKFGNFIKIEKILLTENNPYSNFELRFEGYVYRNNYPGYELLTVNIITDIAGLSSESVSKILRYSDSWWIEISSSSGSVSLTNQIEIELILIKILN